MTSFVRKAISALLVSAVGAITGASADAGFTYIDVDASGTSPVASASQSGGVTTITATDIKVKISNYEDTPLAVALNAFLSYVLTSVGPATLTGNSLTQEFTGHFEVRAGALHTGTNYLSGTGLDGELNGKNTGPLSTSQKFEFNEAGNPTFTSDSAFLTAIFALNSPPTFNYGNITIGFNTPQLPTGGFYDSVTKTYKGFTSSSSAGTFKSDTFDQQGVPEPSSLALLGLGGLGLALSVIRRKRGAAA